MIAELIDGALQRRRAEAIARRTLALRERSFEEGFDALCRWLRDDTPIQSLEADRFRLTEIARRMADRLADDTAVSIAVVGKLGSGKSSLVTLVDEQLRLQKKRIEIVTVSLWPYENTRAAAAGILGAVTKRLRRHINTMGLASLPAEYVRAVEGAGGVYGGMLRLLAGPPDPADSLERIEDVLACIGVNFVVWIEDLERFADGEDQRGPIRALLHKLDTLKNVQVIVASTALDATFDIEKLARYVERIPDLDRLGVFQVLRTFRRGSLEMRPFQLAARSRRREVIDFDREERPGWFAAIAETDGHTSVTDALAEACRTPRQLKQALRQCLFIWERLVGEIDFDDVLVMCMIREARPELFSLIDQFSASLRMGEPRLPGRNENKPTAFRTKLDSLLSTDELRDSVAQLVEFVFPKGGEETVPQGLAGRGRNYWARFQSVPTLGAQERDQDVLDALRDFTESGGQQLVGYLVEGNDVGPFEIFASRLDGADLLTLLAQLTNALLSLQVPLDEEGNPRGLLSIWRLALKLPHDRRFDAGAAHAKLIELTSRCLPKHLFLAEQIVHWFGANDEPKYQLLPTAVADAVTRDFHEQLHSNLGAAAATREGQANMLAGLRSGREVTLLQAVWGVPAIRNGQYLRQWPFAGWESVRDSLLAAAEVAPEVMLGPIAWFVAVQDRSSHDGLDRVVFQQDVAERLFGAERLLAVYAKCEVREFRSPQTRDVYACVKLAATDQNVRQGQPYIPR